MSVPLEPWSGGSTAFRFLTLLLLCASPVAAGNDYSIKTSYQSWDLDGERVNEVFTYATAAMDVRPDLRVALSTGLASVSGGEAVDDVSGMTDTRLRFAYRPTNQWAFRLGLNGPTGQTEISPTSAPLVRVLSDRVVSLPSRVLGRGFDVDLGVAYARPMGKAAIGLGLDFLRKGEFTPYEAQGDYKPGDRVSVAVGVDLSRPAWLWRNSLRFNAYGTDEFRGEAFVKSGTSFDIETTYLYRWLTWSGWITLRRLQIGDPQAELAGLSDRAVSTRSNSETMLVAGAQFRPRTGWRVDASLGARLYSGTDFDEGQARRFDLSVGNVFRLAPTLDLLIDARAAVANLEEPSTLLNLGEGDSLGGFGGAVGVQGVF